MELKQSNNETVGFGQRGKINYQEKWLGNSQIIAYLHIVAEVVKLPGPERARLQC